MKKRISLLVALLMILCLALAGCAQRDNNAGATSNEPTSESHDGGGVGNPDNSGIDDDVEPVGDDVKPGGDSSVAGGEYFVGMNSADEFSYNINGIEISIRTDLREYIDGNIFHFKKLAYDYGWHAMNSDSENSPDNPHFFLDDDNRWEVGFRYRANDYDQIVYTYFVNHSVLTINFARSDRNNDSIQSYTCNKGGSHTVNMAEIIIITYLFENQTENGIDTLDGILAKGTESHYWVAQ